MEACSYLHASMCFAQLTVPVCPTSKPGTRLIDASQDKPVGVSLVHVALITSADNCVGELTGEPATRKKAGLKSPTSTGPSNVMSTVKKAGVETSVIVTTTTGGLGNHRYTRQHGRGPAVWSRGGQPVVDQVVRGQ